METIQGNQASWNANAYQAWLNRFGQPEEAAARIKKDPAKRIGELYKYAGDVRRKRVINLLGSNGSKAVALALLGAEVTIVDFSAANECYAKELAGEAGVRIQYIVADVLQLPACELTQSYDIVLMEKGILHYFQELGPLFDVVSRLLIQGGRLILQDFHPVSTKLISSRGTTANIRKHKVTGDYFDTSLIEKEVAYTKYLDRCAVPNAARKVRLRNWTMGEIVTSIAAEGLYVKSLEELPNLSCDGFDKGIPKSYIIVADKL
ncbi:class I SAM-dependent methyltransferase [Paenibacillus thiaminolyticus]|uniref:Class I SAM-dependent methyltransferase n=1 Tax=Paenibacillus thiaminolyticus TaxID=49283 RepID=A0AAP9DR97_PANTH|nr:class I SAM-dependent methyltransferase [Paenibacillus thiaminolyticus]MCY9537852.1 class I SAM-dependent methyltransferase [Paenibacillus thiaminolyticus]MCY9605144.1 class I SAM-dependent methyltransferase [Paenibacillus thiaminolyticus]MCY9607169.1 class I SAM-dependent methyltransferase [Paenibacillus thiaminolyticus]MCY9616294.1 class I SAM-dependent methyltransferase [Paenibacillus thiaminolyticus]MCY9620053.1 class I SAM-dependent methyltransferase [Paenibacillus thiaminolyticus]